MPLSDLRFLFKYSLMAMVLFCCGPVCSASEDNIVVVKNLKEEWLVWDDTFQTLVPLLGENNTENTIYLWMDAAKFGSYELKFVAEPGMALYSDKKLVYKNTACVKDSVSIKISEFVNERAGKKSLLAFYHQESRQSLSAFIGFKSHEKIPESRVQGVYMRHRTQDHQSGKYLIFFLTFLALIALVRNRYPRRFSEFFNFRNLLPNTSIDENLILGVFSRASLLFLLINAIALYLIVFNLSRDSEFFLVYPFSDIKIDTIWGSILLVLFFFILYLFKYIYLSLIGWIFNLKELVRIHYFELIKIFLKINILFVPLSVILFYREAIPFKVSYENFSLLLFISLAIVIVRIAFLIFKLAGFRNLYLFSYLCATEIIPFIIIIKITSV